MLIDPTKAYRPRELKSLDCTGLRDLKTIRRWMLKHGGRREGQRVVLITGDRLLTALSA